MSGIEVLDVGLVSDEQLMGMAGLPKSSLRSLSLALIKRVQGSTRASTVLLKNALLTKNKLALPMLLFIAQQRTSILYEMRTPHLKLVGNLHDMCQDTLMQLAEYLSTWVTPVDQYALLLPNLADMHCKFHIQPDVSFHLARPAMATALSAGRFVVAGVDAPSQCGTATTGANIPEARLSGALMQWHPCNPDLENVVRTLLPSEVWNCISPAFYLIFWSLRLCDVFVPRDNYAQELRRVAGRLRTLEKESAASARAGTYGLTPEMRRERRALDKKRRLDRATLTKHKEHLEKEEAHHTTCFEGVKALLESVKASWFSADALGQFGKFAEKKARQQTVNEFLQRCVLPRVLFSAEDALFCAKFVDVLHGLDVPYFNTLQYFDKVVRQLTVAVFCVTEREAVCFGVFLKETLSTLMRWHNDKSIYDTEGARPGFALNVSEIDGSCAPFDVFKNIMQRWEDKLLQVFSVAVKSSEWMEVRNAILVLNKILPVFPSSLNGITTLLAVAGTLENEQRSDLKQMGKSYFTKLSRRKEIEWPKESKPAPTKPEKATDAGRDSARDPGGKDRGGNSRDKAPRRERGHGRGGADRDTRRRDGDRPRGRSKGREERNRRSRGRDESKPRDKDRGGGGGNGASRDKGPRRERGHGRGGADRDSRRRDRDRPRGRSKGREERRTSEPIDEKGRGGKRHKRGRDGDRDRDRSKGREDRRTNETNGEKGRGGKRHKRGRDGDRDRDRRDRKRRR